MADGEKKGEGLGNKATAAAKERREALAFGRRRAMLLESVLDVSIVDAVLKRAAEAASFSDSDLDATGEADKDRWRLRQQQETMHSSSLSIPILHVKMMFSEMGEVDVEELLSTVDFAVIDAFLQRTAEADLFAKALFAEADLFAKALFAEAAPFSFSSDSDLVMDMDATGETEEGRWRLRKEQEMLHANHRRLPRRIHMITREMGLDKEEEWAFQLWCMNLARLEENDKFVLNPFEKNVDAWRQLLEVIEQSDLLVMVVDARDPMFFCCPNLEAYAKEIDEHKRTMLLVNKADLLPLNIRKRWADYFKAHDILYVFWSAKAATATLEGKKLSGYSEEESASPDFDTKICGRDELLTKLQAEAESIVAQRSNSTSADDQEASSSDSVSSVAKHVVVGFVGYPNVGKSSTINALVGEKRTGVTHTPGKTKHVLSDSGVLLLEEGMSLLLEEGMSFEQLAIHKLRVEVNMVLAAAEAGRKVNDGQVWLVKELKVLAEDIRIWLQSGFEVQVLIELYVKVAKGIAWLIYEKDCGIAEVTELLKNMIYDFETINVDLESKKALSRKKNGEQVKVFKDCHLEGFVYVNLWIVKKLESLLAKLPLWKGESGLNLASVACMLQEGFKQYKKQLDMLLEKSKGSEKNVVLPPKTYVFSHVYDKISSFCDNESPANVKLSPAAKKLHKTLVESRRQGNLQFVRSINPLFKRKEIIVSEKVNPRCMYCFENTGIYFNTCCDLILCQLCATKRCLFCKNPQKHGENLHFPLIMRLPVFPQNPP